MIFGIKEKSIILIHNNVLLDITTNIPVLLMNGFVVQGHTLSTNTVFKNINFEAYYKCMLITIKLLFSPGYSI